MKKFIHSFSKLDRFKKILHQEMVFLAKTVSKLSPNFYSLHAGNTKGGSITVLLTSK
jgi:hypothetical protein